MCTQSVGLLAGVLEQAGVRTVAIALVRDVAERIGIPRALAVPFPFGRPLGGEGPELQRWVIAQALALLAVGGPVLADFTP